MARWSIDVWSRIVNIWRANFKVKDNIIMKRLAEEDIKVSRAAISLQSASQV